MTVISRDMKANQLCCSRKPSLAEVGVPLGVDDGLVVGVFVGELVGVELGDAVGERVGVEDGVVVGLPVGEADGVVVGLGVGEGVPEGDNCRPFLKHQMENENANPDRHLLISIFLLATPFYCSSQPECVHFALDHSILPPFGYFVQATL